MGAGHVSQLYVETRSPLHAARPECKIVATFLFVLAIVATPREAMWAFACHAAVVATAAAVGRLRPLLVARRLTIEVPFLAFALLLPFLAHGERIDVGPVTVSADGLWGAWNIVAKGTLGVASAVVLTAVTTQTDLLRGLERLRLPRTLVAIMTLMIRFGVVLTDQSRRMQIARTSRGYDPRWIWQVRALASSAGTLFVRSYERGERVYLAMTSRGFTGSLPRTDDTRATPAAWATALTLPLVAAVISCGAWVSM
ncbi:MAG: cobalt ECF transporter T component CbiQ [Streptosporangiales bacterium]|nr:cobalt ECF transporter T component CbiQ [Streptosporangiales bacterium]